MASNFFDDLVKNLFWLVIDGGKGILRCNSYGLYLVFSWLLPVDQGMGVEVYALCEEQVARFSLDIR